MTRTGVALCIVLLAGCAHPLRSAVRFSVGCSMVAHGADIGTTLFGLGAGTVTELNPLLKPLTDSPLAFSVAKMSVATAANYGLLRLAPEHPKWTLALGLSQCVGIGAVAAHNARVIRQATP